MRQVTVRVPVEDLREVLDESGRACLSFAIAGTPKIEPVRFRREAGRYLVAFRPGAERPRAGDEVVLVADDGVLFFHLRAVYVRGRLTPAPEGSGPDWFTVDPILTSAWDYGRMRVADED